MPQLCRTCEHAQRKEIERQARSGTPHSFIAEWLRSQSGGYVSRRALGRHFRDHVGITGTPGRREMSGDLVDDIIARVTERMGDGELDPTLKDGLHAVSIKDKRQARDADRDVLYRLSIVLSGVAPVEPRLVDPVSAAIEAEFRQLLPGGENQDDEIQPLERVRR